MADADLTDPTIYAHWTTDRIRFSDTDQLGHVNNVAIAAYIETGRVDHGFGLAEDMRTERGFVVLRRVCVDYRRELHYPGQVRVGTCILRVGRTSYTTGSAVFKDDVCVATAESVLVMAGPDGPVPIEGEYRDRLEAAALTA